MSYVFTRPDAVATFPGFPMLCWGIKAGTEDWREGGMDGRRDGGRECGREVEWDGARERQRDGGKDEGRATRTSIKHALQL